MTEIILVRHGQANSHAKDEESYDQLSELGHQQASWLGEHMKATNPHFDKVITGTLHRQADTARSMGYDISKQDPRLNELNYFAIAQALEQQHKIPAPKTPQEYAHHLPVLVSHWAQDQLTDIPEMFSGFEARITGIIDELCGQGGRHLLVTSGGVIGIVVRHVLGLAPDMASKVMLQVMNSSVHRLHFIHDQLLLAGFNATPHLDAPDRTHARTFI